MFEIFIVDKIDIVVVMRVEDYGDSKFIEDKRTIKFNTINNKRLIFISLLIFVKEEQLEVGIHLLVP